jgi:metallopeptidase MepB
MSLITFRQPPQLPVAFTHTPESLIWTTKESIASSRKRLGEILKTNPQDATFENSLLPLIHEENELASESRISGLYKAVAVSKELRDASIEAVKLWSAYGLEMALREDRFQIIDAVYKRNEGLDTEAAHYLSMLHAELLQNGLGLPPGPPRKHFESIKNQSKIIKISTPSVPLVSAYSYQKLILYSHSSYCSFTRMYQKRAQ